MRTRLTPAFVQDAKAPASGRAIYWDASLAGFGLMVTTAGHKSYVVQYRANGTSRRLTIRSVLSLDKARKEARAVLGDVAKGRDPLAERRKVEAEATNTLKAVAKEYLAREAKNVRTIEDRRKILERLVYPKFGARQIDSIRRNEIVRLLDKIEDENGAVMADHVLAYVRRLFNWHAGRSDDFRSPIVRGMARTKPKERKRQRILSDDELRAVWRTAEGLQTPFGYLVRLILLQAPRRNEAARMRRSEISGADWTVPGSRHKSKRAFLVPLSNAAMDLLAHIPVIGRRNDTFVFTLDGKKPINGFSKAKRALDELVLAEFREHDSRAKPFPRWTLHDLRRTARSLMSRAGADPDHAEMALGHVLPGIRGVYDVYQYREEKRRVFEALAAQIDRIIHPPENVVELKRGAAQ